MTTSLDNIELHEDPSEFWDLRIKACRWMIFKTFCLGVLAAALGVLAQGWLEDAAPMFPFISQNYGVWQACYLMGLLLVFVLWAAAMLQKISLLQNSQHGRKTQQRIEEQNARVLAKMQAAKERREQERKERESTASLIKNSPRNVLHNAPTPKRSNKFDY
jgi:heme exporter protein D